MNLGLIVFSTGKIPTIIDGAYVINLDDKKSKGTQCVSLYIDRYAAVYFASSWIWYIAQDILNKI